MTVELILNAQYKHGPENMKSELAILTLVYIGTTLVVVKDSKGSEKSMPLEFFLEYCHKV